MGGNGTKWTCPVCAGAAARDAFRRQPAPVSQVGPDEMAPAAAAFGTALDRVVRCRRCRHGSLARRPDAAELDAVYAHVEDAATLDEEPGQRATARRDLLRIRARLDRPPGRLLDVGCWTGALLTEARELGWAVEGIEPSEWAARQATSRGHQVRRGTLDDVDLEPGAHQVITCCDVLEHLIDPAAGARRLAHALEPEGLLFATVPDAGSVLARGLGGRWWSVLPMHVQYFTRRSMRSLLEGAGFEVVEVRTHPKVFTWGYYADRMAAFAPAVGRPLARTVGRTRLAERPFVPDLRDRMAVIARRRAEEVRP